MENPILIHKQTSQEELNVTVCLVLVTAEFEGLTYYNAAVFNSVAVESMHLFPLPP